ncbi:MAG: CAP domain-containing protein [Nitrososphaeraceae archaeon]
MNRINNFLLLLMLTLFILPASVIMYAGGSTEGTDESSDGGSTEGNDGSSTTSTGGDISPSESTFSNNTGIVQQPSEAFANDVLAIHNRERDAIGVPSLTWSDTLAADAQEYADHLVAIGKAEHMWQSESDEWSKKAHGANENIAWQGGHSSDPAGQANIAEYWVKEKQYFDGTLNSQDGHYTQMIWKVTTELGCGIATGFIANMNSEGDVLVCRYLPSGNTGPDPLA